MQTKLAKKNQQNGRAGGKKLAFLNIYIYFATFIKISARLKHFLLEAIFCQKMKKKLAKKISKMGGGGSKKIGFF